MSHRNQKKNQLRKQKGELYPIRLNRYIAHSGICSRRAADDLIRSGQIKVNNEIITEMGFKVQLADKVLYQHKPIRPERLVYVLLNKPKDFITTMDDTHDRRTVMELVAKACDERIFPVGRLDRNTTGLLLFTNDGHLAEKLTHPSYQIKKIYRAELDRGLRKQDFEKLQGTLKLEDGPVKLDDAALLSADKKHIGLEIHTGRNRIVHRIFEHLGYELMRLDRSMYGPLTKKDLPRGRWRHLSAKELIVLKNLS